MAVFHAGAWWAARLSRVIVREVLMAKALLRLDQCGLSALMQSAQNSPYQAVNYYLYLNDEQAGPYSEAEIVSMVVAGQISGTDFVWREGMAEWLPIEAVITLGAAPASSFPPAQAQIFLSSKSKQRAGAPTGPVAKKYFVFAGALALLAVAAYSVSPFWAIHKLRKAAEAKDAVYITDSVDFPAFRESLKGALSAQMAKEAAASQEDGGFGAIGAAFGAMMVGPLVDALVTPEAVIGLMQGKDLGAVTGGPGADIKATASPSQEEQNDVSTSMRYEGLNRFVVAMEDKDKKAASLVFQRHGLFSWKLSGVRLQGE